MRHRKKSFSEKLSIGCTPQGSYDDTRFREWVLRRFWGGFWGRVLRRVLRREPAMGFAVGKGSEKGSQKGVLRRGGFKGSEKGVSRSCLAPLRVRPPGRAPTQVFLEILRAPQQQQQQQQQQCIKTPVLTVVLGYPDLRYPPCCIQ